MVAWRGIPKCSYLFRSFDLSDYKSLFEYPIKSFMKEYTNIMLFFLNYKVHANFSCVESYGIKVYHPPMHSLCFKIPNFCFLYNRIIQYTQEISGF